MELVDTGTGEILQIQPVAGMFALLIIFIVTVSFQCTLMTEIREIVAIEDRVKFDELVYRRGDSNETPILIRDSTTAREHDYRHSRVGINLL